MKKKSKFFNFSVNPISECTDNPRNVHVIQRNVHTIYIEENLFF
jgi:hypothetical protein